MTEIMLKRDVVMVDVPCSACGFVFMVPQDFDKSRRDTGDDFYCPSCRSTLHYRSEREALKRQVSFWENRYNDERDRHANTENRRRALASNLTKMRKRVAAGVCPCCKRHFTNLERHIATKHPNFSEETLTPP